MKKRMLTLLTLTLTTGSSTYPAAGGAAAFVVSVDFDDSDPDQVEELVASLNGDQDDLNGLWGDFFDTPPLCTAIAARAPNLLHALLEAGASPAPALADSLSPARRDAPMFVDLVQHLNLDIPEHRHAYDVALKLAQNDLKIPTENIIVLLNILPEDAQLDTVRPTHIWRLTPGLTPQQQVNLMLLWRLYNERAMVNLEDIINAPYRTADGLNETPLMRAARFGYPDLAAFLVEHGADWELTNNEGLSAAAVARAAGHHDIADYLDLQETHLVKSAGQGAGARSLL